MSDADSGSGGDESADSGGGSDSDSGDTAMRTETTMAAAAAAAVAAAPLRSRCRPRMPFSRAGTARMPPRPSAVAGWRQRAACDETGRSRNWQARGAALHQAAQRSKAQLHAAGVGTAGKTKKKGENVKVEQSEAAKPCSKGLRDFARCAMQGRHRRNTFDHAHMAARLTHGAGPNQARGVDLHIVRTIQGMPNAFWSKFGFGGSGSSWATQQLTAKACQTHTRTQSAGRCRGIVSSVHRASARM